MTKKLDPEIKALRACERALRPLPMEAQDRATVWLRSYVEQNLRRELNREARGLR